MRLIVVVPASATDLSVAIQSVVRPPDIVETVVTTYNSNLWPTEDDSDVVTLNLLVPSGGLQPTGGVVDRDRFQEFRVRSIDAASLATILREFCRDIAVAVNRPNKSVIVRGNREQIDEVAGLVQQLEAGEADLDANSRQENDTPDSSAKLRSQARLRQEYQASDQEARDTATRLRQSRVGDSDGHHRSLRASLKRIVGESFALRQALHEVELENLERHLKQAREMLEYRQRIKRQIIDRRVEDLLNAKLPTSFQDAKGILRSNDLVSPTGKSFGESVEAAVAGRERTWAGLQGTWILRRTKGDAHPLTISIEGRKSRLIDANEKVRSATMRLDIRRQGRITLEFDPNGTLHETWAGKFELQDEQIVFGFESVSWTGLGGSNDTSNAQEERLFKWSGFYQRAGTE
jgi:hypothetical protein